MTETTRTISAQEVRRNRWMLIAVITLFALPVALAYLGYFGGWFADMARANKGELLLPIQNIEEYSLTFSDKPFNGENLNHKWWLVLVHAENDCDKDCQQFSLYTVNQTWVALGKEQERVIPSLLSPPSIKLPDGWQWLSGKFDHGVIHDAKQQRQLQNASIYIIDPMGNVVMRYVAPATLDAAVKLHKDIQSDFSKLLKNSHIG